MTERPILFKAEMIRAILDGRKTQTRRVIKPQPEYKPEGGFDWYQRDKKMRWHQYSQADFMARCPYGAPGTKLWLRETFWERKDHVPSMQDLNAIRYDADMDLNDSDCRPQLLEIMNKKPSIFMPRWASRITLEVKDVRVERVQEIGWQDTIAEGISDPRWSEIRISLTHERSPLVRFRALWNSINASPKPIYEHIDGKKTIVSYVSYPWENVQDTREHRGKPWKVIGNPWIWAIDFKMKGDSE